MRLDNKLIVKNGVALYDNAVKFAHNEFERVRWNCKERL
jgi:hypothetical protein